MSPPSPIEPPPTVLAAFGSSGRPRRLPGGAGSSHLAGDLVLKQIDDPAETSWVQACTQRLAPDGFRVARPVRASSGEWVVDRWVASEYIDGLEPVLPAWDRIIDVGRRFSTAAARSLDGSERVLADRTHRWAVADRVAWAEIDVALGDEATSVLDRLRELLSAPTTSEAAALIHGDLAGNVFVDADGTPVVLDISPYLRPLRWSEAIVVADATLWLGADLGLASRFADDERTRDLLGRALIYRMVAEQLAEHPRHGARLAPYRAVLDQLAGADRRDDDRPGERSAPSRT